MSQRRIRVLVNPAAGGGRIGRNLGEIRARLRAALGCEDIVATAAPGDAARLATAASAEGVELLVSVGGDGTHSEVANGLLAVASGNTRLALVDAGSGGDFCRQWPDLSHLEDWCRLALDADATAVDVLRVEGASGQRHALNMVTTGLGGEVVARVAEGHGVGASAYLRGALQAFRSYRNPSLEWSLDDSPSRQAPHLIACVCNGSHAGGGMRFAPTARLDDGCFQFVVVAPRSLPAALGLAVSLRLGDLRKRPGVAMQAARKVHLAGEDIAVEVDGELVGTTPVTVEVVPGALRLVGANQSTAGRM